MKRWMKNLLLCVFLLLAVPVIGLAAEMNGGSLTVEKNDVTVSLNIPEGKTEKITSLRFQMRVTLQEGGMEEPTFQFADTVTSVVKDVVIRMEENDSYVVDLILSGKKDQDIFGDSEHAGIGVLSLHPNSDEYKIKVELIDEASGNDEASVKYVDSSGLTAFTIPLADTDAVVVEEPKEQQTGVFEPKPQVSIPELKTSTKKGKNRIYFEWTKVLDADGYLLYQCDAATEQEKLIKTITGRDVTTFSKKYSYGSTFSFKICAYKESTGGKITGECSTLVSATVPPARVKGVTAVRRGAKKVTLSWKKVKNASGYQIFRSTKKNGKYTRCKTIKKGTTIKYTKITQKSGKKYYYKVRAYVKGADGQHVYGRFSVAKTGGVSAVPAVSK